MTPWLDRILAALSSGVPIPAVSGRLALEGKPAPRLRAFVPLHFPDPLGGGPHP
jgi:hypothetical protein